MAPIKTLIDSGSSRNFIDITFARHHNLPLIELQQPRRVITINGNKTAEKICFRTKITFTLADKTFTSCFYTMPLGEEPIIIGNEWLVQHNPNINWRTMEIEHREVGRKGTDKSIPDEFQDFADVFDAKEFKNLPPHREHDCSIPFKEEAKLPNPARAYPMSPDHQKTLKEFLEQELKDGKIRPSKSPVAAPCFYVKKADGSLRLVTDY